MIHGQKPLFSECREATEVLRHWWLMKVPHWRPQLSENDSRHKNVLRCYSRTKDRKSSLSTMMMTSAPETLSSSHSWCTDPLSRYSSEHIFIQAASCFIVKRWREIIPACIRRNKNIIWQIKSSASLPSANLFSAGFTWTRSVKRPKTELLFNK